MSALAQLFVFQSKVISGSDIEEEFVTDHVLADHGITVVPFSEENISTSVDLVVASTAYSIDQNPDLTRANKLNVPIVFYDDALAWVFNSKEGIAVTGSHGKSTTSALVAHVLTECKLDPSAVIGAEVVQWRSNARVSDSKYMVVEADEYQAKFTKLIPKFTIITNIDWDHPDHYTSQEEYEQEYLRYVESLPSDSIVLVNENDEASKRVFGNTKRENIKWFSQESLTNDMLIGGGLESSYGAVIGLGVLMGLNEADIRAGIQSFQGIKRRGELLFERDEVKIYDDYAHHPTEISAVLRAFRARYPDNPLVVMFQAHTISRTEAFLQDFGPAFQDADEVIVVPTYFSAREGGDSSEADQNLYDIISQNLGSDHVQLAQDFTHAESLASELIGSGGSGYLDGCGRCQRNRRIYG